MSSLNQPTTHAQWPEVEPNGEIRELYVSLEREFPQAAAEFTDGLSRRRWLQLMGASLALTGAVGCRYQVEKIAPYVFRPRDRDPGTYHRYATTIDRDGVALPLLVNTVDGRPLKIDGNPDHSDSLGRADIFTQARMLDLYDPDRSTTPSVKSGSARREATWAEFESTVGQWVHDAESNQGASLAILAQPDSSPSRRRLKEQLLAKFPQARWFEYSPIGNDNELFGCHRAFGKYVQPQIAYDQCKVLVTIDADILSFGGSAVRTNAGFAEARNPEKEWMSRVYAVESQFTLVGGSADHRLALAPSQMASFVATLESAIESEPAEPGSVSDARDRFLAAMVQDLRSSRGTSAVVCGWSQPPEVHAAVWRINQALGNLGTTIRFTAAEERNSYVSQIQQLTEALSGSVDTLFILDGNPAYDAPADLKFADALGQVKHSAYLGENRNETSAACEWFANTAHPLEAWGDGRSPDGSVCIAQPMIKPLYGGLSKLEFLSLLSGEKLGGLEIVRKTAEAWLPETESENAWVSAVEMGFIPGTANEFVDVAIVDAGPLTPQKDWKVNWEGGKLELILTPSRQQFDGRFANNGWLQELPDFITKLTWDNAAILSPRTARIKNWDQGQFIRIEADGGVIELPVHIQPGHANGTVTVALGYGRTLVGRVGGDIVQGIPQVGADAYRIRTTSNLYGRPDIDPTTLPRVERLALVQDPFTLDEMGRSGIRHRLGENSRLVRSGSFSDYRAYVTEHGPLVDVSELRTEHVPTLGESSHGQGSDHAASEGNGRHLPVINGDHPAGNSNDQPNHNGKDDGHAAHSHDVNWPQGFAPHFANKSLTPGPQYSSKHVWSMAVDLSKCTGCSACVIACQAENNVPVVGKEQVSRGREMHWIRIDAYVVEDPKTDPDAENPEFKFQPMLCQQCENAPCETVCPVAATVHSDEGLNDMVYNRCIGTRYCGNNCPYKVRRFNYLNYSEAVTFLKYPNEGKYSEREKMLRGLGVNPEVTVRSRGVMEKCTYCVQRIQNTKILARNEHRTIGPNEITTACQDACPTEALVFGNMADSKSDLQRKVRSVRAYQLLGELGNLPRTRYLARVRNPHPALVRHASTESHS